MLFYLVYEGLVLFGSISNHDCKILHLDEEWVVNTFVNLSVEKFPYIPVASLPQNLIHS